jgi:6,7-dimethyl-8-ribityllumazine synthase
LRIADRRSEQLMSKSTPPRGPVAKAKRTFHVVASRFNAQYVDGLIQHVTEELRALAPESTILVHRVPGSFEIPVIARELALQNKGDAIIA